MPREICLAVDRLLSFFEHRCLPPVERYRECDRQTELIKVAFNIMLVGKADAAEDRSHEPSGRNDRLFDR